jgi:hypothetical protein
MPRTWGQIRFELAKFCPGVDPQLLNQWIVGAYHRILDYRNWKGLEVDTFLQTVAIYETGTVAVTLGSTAVTGTGTTWTTAMSGRRFRVEGASVWYTFTRTGNTTGTLDRAYEGDTDAEASYRIFQNVYSLPAGVKLIQLLDNPSIGRPMDIETQATMSRISTGRVAYGEPQLYSPASDNSDTPPLKTVELYPIPIEAKGYPLQYQTIPTDFSGSNTSASPLPWVSDDAIVAFAKASLLRHGKDYNGASEEEGIGRGYLTEMSEVENRRIGPTRIRMAERFTRHRQRRWAR